MKTFYITFRSITLAQRGEKALRGAGLRCTLQRTPRWMEEQGCGYALRLNAEDPGDAVALLRSQNLPLRRVYTLVPSGRTEEVPL